MPTNRFAICPDWLSIVAERAANRSTCELGVLALGKGDERYAFIFSKADRTRAIRAMVRCASNPDLSFTMYDAAVLTEKIKEPK